jgi:hypothetical protein
MTKLCEFCSEYDSDGTCRLGRLAPRGFGCRDYAPEMASFFSNPLDFTGVAQVIQMATFFGFRGSEMKKVKFMAVRAADLRAAAAVASHSLAGDREVMK